jgi:response regulator RpfG family c-di-GMP phosphodiesterase
LSGLSSVTIDVDLSAARPPSPPSPKTKLVCEALVRDKVLTADQGERAIAEARASGERIEEVLLDLEMTSEADLLKSLAARYKVHFISAEKLAKADVARALLDMIPQRFAEKIGVCPVVFDATKHVLTVVTADPDDSDLMKEVQLASGAREVKTVLARPAAVKALITKAYTGDQHAFALLDRQAHMQFHSIPAPRDRGMVLEDNSSQPLVRGGGNARERVLSPDDLKRSPAVPLVPRTLSAPPPPRPAASASPAERKAAAPAPPPPVLIISPPTPAILTPGPFAFAVSEAATGPSFLELLNVLVSLLENARTDLRGHSAQVARLARRLAEKLSLDAATTAGIVCAAYVHDLGKMGQYHLTALNCSEYDGHKVAAQKVFGVPARLLEPVRMPPEAAKAVDHMYERYDGKGFPDGQSGKDAPLGARILAICDTYADLTQNPRNPYRKALAANEACAALTKHKGTIFDPNLVDLFHHTVLGEDLKARLLSSRSQALLVDPDPEETTVLELRMIEQGFVVKTARNPEQALKVLAEGDTDLVIGEVDLGSNDGLMLLAQVRQAAWGKDLPWVIYTRRQERAVAQKAFELGVLDFVNKPANADVLVAKMKALLDQRASARASRGVSGSLREMGLPDMVQVLFHGRKSGNLRIRAREGSGEIHFVDGNVVNAMWGEQLGEDAFFAMLRLEDGEFALDPAFKPTGRVIHQSSEALLLEGMRRMDEGVRS